MAADDPIATARLLLRRFTADDAAAWLPLIATPAILRYVGETAVTSLEQSRRLLRERPLQDYATHGFGRLACIERRSGRLVGFCGLKFVPALGEVDLGYRFLPECWGQGYASESAAAVMAHGWDAYGLARIVGQVHPDNLTSTRVLLKLGMQYQRQLDSDGETSHLYAIDRPTLLQRTAGAASTDPAISVPGS